MTQSELGDGGKTSFDNASRRIGAFLRKTSLFSTMNWEEEIAIDDSHDTLRQFPKIRSNSRGSIRNLQHGDCDSSSAS